jgi:hypothetical protein
MSKIAGYTSWSSDYMNSPSTCGLKQSRSNLGATVSFVIINSVVAHSPKLPRSGCFGKIRCGGMAFSSIDHSVDGPFAAGTSASSQTRGVGVGVFPDEREFACNAQEG